MALYFSESQRKLEYENLWSNRIISENLIYVHEHPYLGINLDGSNLTGYFKIIIDLGDSISDYKDYVIGCYKNGNGNISVEFRSSEDKNNWSSSTSSLTDLPVARYVEVKFNFSRDTSNIKIVLYSFEFNFFVTSGYDLPDNLIEVTDNAVINMDAKLYIETKNRYWSNISMLDTKVNFSGNPMNVNNSYVFDACRINENLVILGVGKIIDNAYTYGIYLYKYNPTTNSLISDQASLEVTGGLGYDANQPFRINYLANGKNGPVYWVTYMDKKGKELKIATSPDPWSTNWTRTTLFDGSITVSLENKYYIYHTPSGTKTAYYDVDHENAGLFGNIVFSGNWEGIKPEGDITTDYRVWQINLMDTSLRSAVVSFEGSSLTLVHGWGGSDTNELLTLDIYSRKYGETQWKFEKTITSPSMNLEVFRTDVSDKYEVKINFTSLYHNTLDDFIGLTNVNAYRINIADAPVTQENLNNWYYQKIRGTNRRKDALQLSAKSNIVYNNGWQVEWLFNSNSAFPINVYLNSIKFDISYSCLPSSWRFRVFAVKENGSRQYWDYQGNDSDTDYYTGTTIEKSLMDDNYVSWGIQLQCAQNNWSAGEFYISLPQIIINNIIVSARNKDISTSLYDYWIWYFIASDKSIWDKYSSIIFGDAFVCDFRENVFYENIQDWLIIGYWDGYSNANAALDSTDQVNPANEPVVGLVENGKTWVKYFSPNPYKIDMMDLWGSQSPLNCVAWLCTYIYSPDDMNITMNFGCDDGVKIYLLREGENSFTGRLIAEKRDTRPLSVNEFSVNLQLYAGWNRLYVKLSNGSILPNKWEFQASIPDAKARGLFINTSKTKYHELMAIAFQAPFRQLLGIDMQFWEGGDDIQQGVFNNWFYVNKPEYCLIRTKSGITYQTGWEAQMRWRALEKDSTIRAIVFDYETNLPSGWQFRICNDEQATVFMDSQSRNVKDKDVYFNGEVKGFSFRLYYNGGGNPSPGESAYIKISNIRIYFKECGRSANMHCRLNWSGNPTDWNSETASKQYIFWTEALTTAPAKITFFEHDGALRALAQRLTADNILRLMLFTLNSSLSLAPDSWESKELMRLPSVNGQTYFQNIAIDRDLYNRCYITHNLVTKSDNYKLDCKYLMTYHPEHVSSALLLPSSDEMVLKWIPCKDTIIAFLAKKGQSYVYRRELLDSSTVVDISDIVTSFNFDRNLESSADRMSLTIMALTDRSDLRNPSDALYWTIPRSWFDRKPRLVKAKMARFLPGDTPKYDNVFVGIIGATEDSLTSEENIFNINVYGLGYQLNKFNAPEVYLYASPIQLFVDNFRDNYSVMLDQRQLVIPSSLSSTLWIGDLNNFKVYPNEGIAEHRVNSSSIIKSKNFAAYPRVRVLLDMKLINNGYFSLGINDVGVEYDGSKIQLYDGSEKINAKYVNLDLNTWYTIAFDLDMIAKTIRGIILKNGCVIYNTGVGRISKVYKSYLLKFIASAMCRIANPRVLRTDMNEYEKTDIDIVKDVLYKASQGVFNVNIIESGYRNPLIGFVIWEQGKSALEFLNQMAKRFNMRWYFDRNGNFVWEPNIFEGNALTISNSAFSSFTRSYDPMEYVNWVEVYAEMKDQRIKREVVDVDCLTRFGVRYKLVEESSVEVVRDAELTAYREYYNEIEGAEVASLELSYPFYEIEPTTTLRIIDTIGKIDDYYFVNAINISYSTEDPSVSISLNLDSRAKAERQFLASMYEGGMLLNERTQGS